MQKLRKRFHLYVTHYQVHLLRCSDKLIKVFSTFTVSVTSAVVMQWIEEEKAAVTGDVFERTSMHLLSVLLQLYYTVDIASDEWLCVSFVS